MCLSTSTTEQWDSASGASPSISGDPQIVLTKENFPADWFIGAKMAVLIADPIFERLGDSASYKSGMEAAMLD
jgi:hypothetical protein